MSFLAPLFLLGGLAIALPVIFHLVRRTTRTRTRFSSLMFLRPAPPRLTRRNRLEHWLLLLLRCVVLALLALGFARPFFKQDVPAANAGAPGKRVVVLVDTSASMRRAGLWTAARDQVEAVLRPLSADDQVALFTFDRQLTPLVSFEQWKATSAGERTALARSRLTEVQPGWGGTQLDQAMLRAAELLLETDPALDPGPRQIVVITDFQEGSQLNALPGRDWPAEIEVVVHPLKSAPASNAGLQWAGASTDADPTTEPGVRVRVQNAPDARREQFQVGWARPGHDGFIGAPLELYVPAGQSRMVTVPAPASATNPLPHRLVLRGDDEDFDNTLHVVPPEPVNLSVLYFGTEPATDARQPLYFLRRAFQETPRRAVRVEALAPDISATAGQWQAATLAVVAAALPVAQTRALHDWAAQGKTVLCVLTGPAMAATLAGVLQLEGLTVAEGRPANYAMLGQIDFQHPLFAPFADARFSDFTKIHFWKYRRLDASALPDARVVARFDDGEVALAEVSVGLGRVLVLTAGWHPADSQLALSSKFVPLLYALLEQGGGAAPATENYRVGDPVPLPVSLAAANSTLTLRQPDGTALPLLTNATHLPAVRQPGIYHFESGRGTQRFAVNLDPAESRTAPLPLDELERLGVAGARPTPPPARVQTRQARLHNAELEGRQKLWRWFLGATLAVLLFETWLAGRTTRRLAASPAPAS